MYYIYVHVYYMCIKTKHQVQYIHEVIPYGHYKQAQTRIQGRIKKWKFQYFLFSFYILQELSCIEDHWFIIEFSLSHHQLWRSIHLEKVLLFNSSGLIIVVIMR